MPPATPPILIHVPKSGGTTLVMAVSGGRRPPRVGDSYRHVYWNVDRTRMHSNAGDIFTEAGAERHRDRVKILTVRRPIDRLESEFGFLGNREEFRRLWTSMSGGTYPGTFHDFVRHPNAADATTKFLLCRDLYDPEPVTEGDLDRILRDLTTRTSAVRPKTCPRPWKPRGAGHPLRRHRPRHRTSGKEARAWFGLVGGGGRVPRTQPQRSPPARRDQATIRRADRGVAVRRTEPEGGRYDSIFSSSPAETTGHPSRSSSTISTIRPRATRGFVRDATPSRPCRPRRFDVERGSGPSSRPGFEASPAFPELGRAAIDASDPLKTVRDVCLRAFG